MYDEHGRIIEGDLDTITETAYRAWATDIANGLASVLIADAHQLVTDLNQRARHDRILTGHVNPTRHVTLQDETRASAGDHVITRHNERHLVAGRTGWVRNGDRWTITRVHADGALTIQRQGGRAKVVLPASYVAEHVDLGYAITAHRAQGITVDTAHCLVTPSTTRENLYVGMTRARNRNTAYVATDRPDATHTAPHPDDLNLSTARTVLAGVLADTGTEPAAHTAAASELEQWGSIRQLCAEREIILAAALTDHWARLIRATDLTPTQAEQVIASHAFRPLCAGLYRAHTNNQPPHALLQAAVRAGGLDNPSDPATILCRRIETLNDHTPTARPHRSTRMIAGIIPDTDIAIAPEMRHTLDQYNTVITRRAQHLAHRAIQQSEPWLQTLGLHPTGHTETQRWEQAATALAVYRELHHIAGPNPYGTPTPSETPNGHLAHIRQIIAGMTNRDHPVPAPPAHHQPVPTL
jgi:hypothetical protein